jgi:lipoyl(octanoyl) transferase
MEFEVLDLGRLGYGPSYDRQLEVHKGVLSGDLPDTLILVEHPPVLTLGANFHEENLLFPADAYAAKGIEVVRTDRGGDVTYHGPGQVVAYPIFHLEPFGKDLHRWLRSLEEVVIDTLRPFGIAGTRNPVNTGVWVENRKICAMGIKVRRWVSLHGLALNCDTDLTPFGTIVPCGIQGAYGVTSMSSEVCRRVGIEEVKPVLVEAFNRLNRSNS